MKERYEGAQGRVGRESLAIQMIKELHGELNELCKARHASSRSAVLSLVNEQEGKWKAFINKLSPELKDTVKETGFRDYIRFYFPSLEVPHVS
jgi:hypothetical protein